MGVKFVIEMNMIHGTYLGYWLSGAEQLVVNPGRGMLHDWPYRVV